MIEIKSNIALVSARIMSKVAAVQNAQQHLRAVAIDVAALMNERIHEDGKDASGAAIGQYSNAYLKYRQANGRGSDATKKITFSRQLEKAIDVVGTAKGWGIGILNDKRLPLNNFLNKKNKAKGKKWTNDVKVSNAELVEYQEAQTGRKIWSLTKAEKEYAVKKLAKHIEEALK